MDIQKGEYHFKLNGEFLTNFLREISLYDMVKAIDIGMNDIGLLYWQSFAVCAGHLKLVNNKNDNNLFHLEPDNVLQLHGKVLYNEKFDVNVVEQMPLSTNPFKI